MTTTADRLVHTHCLICEQLCGLEVSVVGGKVASIRPDKKNPYSWRDFCVKGQRSHEVAESPWRLRSPMRRVGSRFVPATYEEAIADIANRLTAIMDEDGRDAVAGYSGNPMGFSFGAQMFHSGLMAAIGTHQKFTVQSIDTNAKYVATEAVFGTEMLALVPDVDDTDCAMLIGTNPAISKFNWGGKVPNGWRRLKDRVREGAQLIVVDPRRTETATAATIHLAPHPETDWALLLGMIQVIFAEGFVRLPEGVRVEGLDDLQRLARSRPIDALAGICGVPADQIVSAARTFGQARRAFAFAGTGPALGMHGVLTQWLALALNVLTDRVDRIGGRVLPTGQVRNVSRALKAGGSSGATQPTPSRVRGLRPVVGHHSLAELADEITTPGEGRIRALILGGGNPVSTGADGDRLAVALRQLDLLVCIDLFQRESHRDADWLIPAAHFLEREEIHVGIHAMNDRPFIQTSRQALDLPEGMWPEWRFYRELADAMGLELWGGARTPDELAVQLLVGSPELSVARIREAEHGLVYGERNVGELLSLLKAEDLPITLCTPRLADQLEQALDGNGDVGAPAMGTFRMISRRRNGMMNSALAEFSGRVGHDETADTVEINKADAACLDLVDGEAVAVGSSRGTIEARARLSDDVRPGTVVMVHGWGSATYDPTTGHKVGGVGNQRNKLVSDADLDPLSAVPRLNGTPVSIEKAHS